MMAYTEVFAAQGDVVLVVNSGTTKPEYLVSSQQLSLASPVFRVMLSPFFLEGQNISSALPKEIELPEDAAGPIRLLCSLTHFTPTETFPDGLSAPDFLQFAKLVDKYDCRRALRYANEAYFSRHKKNVDKLSHLLQAACYVDDAAAFETISAALGYRLGQAALSRLATVDDVLPKKVYGE